MSQMDGIVELVDALSTKLRALGYDSVATRIGDAFYGATTGSEMVTGIRYELMKVDRRKLGAEVSLIIELERLLPR